MEAKSEKTLPQNEFYERLNEESREYGASKELHDMGSKKSVTDHDHYFEVASGNQAYCNCGFGLFLDMEDSVSKGRIFRHGKQVI